MTPSTQFQDLVGEFYSRRLLLVNPSPPPSIGHGTPSSSEPYGSDNSFDSNVVMVLSVLLCALICSLGLNSIIRCALRCSSFVASDSSSGASRATSARLANTGVKRKALKTFPVVSYSADLNLPGLDSECVICISEFTQGERIRLLPKCNHGFHVRCIDKWLSSHSSCPTCRHCLIETCQKIVGSYSLSSQVTATSAPPPPPPPSQVTATSAPPPPPPRHVIATSAPSPPPPPPAVHLISIPPLEPEGFVRNYRGDGN